MTFLKSNDY